MIAEERESEMWEFIRLTPQQIGLKYDIYVDNGSAYKNHHHQLWLYVDIDSKKIPVTVENEPSAILYEESQKYNLDEIFHFIHINQKLLMNLADGITDDSIFFRLLKKIK